MIFLIIMVYPELFVDVNCLIGMRSETLDFLNEFKKRCRCRLIVINCDYHKIDINFNISVNLGITGVNIINIM